MDVAGDSSRSRRRRRTTARSSLLAHTEPVFSVAVNAAHPEMLATGGGDDVAHLWRLGTVRRRSGSRATRTRSARSRSAWTARCWRRAGSTARCACGRPTRARSSARRPRGRRRASTGWRWHPRGAVLLAGSEDATAWMWKLPEGSVMQIFSAHSSSVACAPRRSRANSRAHDSAHPRGSRSTAALSPLRYGGFANGGKR